MTITQQIREVAQYWRHRLTTMQERRELGRAFASGTLTERQALRMLPEIEQAAGHYALESIAVDLVIEEAEERWFRFPHLDEIAGDAVDNIGRKWNSDGHLTNAARDWALDLIEEKATDRGIVLVERADA